MVMIPQEEWQLLNDKLDRLAEMIENRNTTDRDAEWLGIRSRSKLLESRPKHGRITATSVLSLFPDRPQNLRQPRRPRRSKMAIDQMFDAIELPEFDWQFEQPSDELTPAEIARRTRYSLGLHRGAIGNLTVLLEDHGVIIQKMDFGTEKMDGLTSITDRGRRVIFLNTRMPNDRMRFSLAHELGHLIMHLSFVPKHPERVEDEANEFASEFLMPEAEIKSSLKRITLPMLGNLKQQWGVSMRALIRRARDLQMIDDKIYRNYQIIFSKKATINANR